MGVFGPMPKEATMRKTSWAILAAGAIFFCIGWYSGGRNNWVPGAGLTIAAIVRLVILYWDSKE